MLSCDCVLGPCHFKPIYFDFQFLLKQLLRVINIADVAIYLVHLVEVDLLLAFALMHRRQFMDLVEVLL